MLKNILNSIRGKYLNDNEFVVIAVFYNVKNNPYRLSAFNKFYDSIKHLNYRIIEATYKNEERQLNINDPNITYVELDSYLWVKEKLLNQIIKNLPSKFKYVAWVDGDIIFQNKNWIINSINLLKDNVDIMQPFEYCIHLEKDEIQPRDEIIKQKSNINNLTRIERRVWRSFASNIFTKEGSSSTYDIRGHVGFAWVAKRSILESAGLLYEGAQIGGADGVMAYATMSPDVEPGITTMFGNTNDIIQFTRKWYKAFRGRIGSVDGDIYHIWHGDIEKREYYNRIKNFSSIESQTEKADYFDDYMTRREDTSGSITDYQSLNDNDTQPTIIDHKPHFDGFGGGDFGGAGATTDWALDSNKQNFS